MGPYGAGSSYISFDEGLPVDSVGAPPHAVHVSIAQHPNRFSFEVKCTEEKSVGQPDAID